MLNTIIYRSALFLKCFRVDCRCFGGSKSDCSASFGAQESAISDDEEDEEKDELDVLAERVYGQRRSDRKRKEPERMGFLLSSSQVDFAQTGSEDSDANGMD
jgi:hypothetical protein